MIDVIPVALKLNDTVWRFLIKSFKTDRAFCWNLAILRFRLQLRISMSEICDPVTEAREYVILVIRIIGLFSFFTEKAVFRTRAHPIE